LVFEFWDLDWLTMVVAHGHLFLFFPVFGLLALVAFFLPSVVLADLYWNHVSYGKARFIVGALVLAGLAFFAAWSLHKQPRPSYAVSPAALAAARGGRAKGRAPILDVLGGLRETAQHRFGLSSFGRSCAPDPLLELPDEMLKARYCFPARKNLLGEACCAVQN